MAIQEVRLQRLGSDTDVLAHRATVAEVRHLAAMAKMTLWWMLPAQ